MFAATIGAALPVALSFLLLYLGFGFGRIFKILLSQNIPDKKKVLWRHLSLEQL
jgi:hypothetical protein